MSTRSTPRQPVNRSSGPDGRVIAVAIGLVVVVAAIAAFSLAGGDDDSETTAGGTPEEVALANFGAVRVEGDPLPPLPEGEAVGAPAPTIISEQSSGTVRVEPGADGEPTMLVFLAHWCPHCQAELPNYVELADDGAFEGIRTVAVLTSTTDQRENYPPSQWLDEEGWSGDRFYDDRNSAAASAYGVRNFPTTVFLDADGAVAARYSGAQSDDDVRAAADRARG